MGAVAMDEREVETRLDTVGKKLLEPPDSKNELVSLLDQAGDSLLKVAQLPSRSMSKSLYPLMKALILKELLRHLDIDVRVAVAYCISEITRIAAPSCPYDDDLMKEIFQLIVDTFGQLDDTSSHLYFKRVSVLENFATFKLCLVMLDLELDALILDMFRSFMKTVRSSNRERVFSFMEDVMTLVIEESEDISLDLLTYLLSTAKKNCKDFSPIACSLGEKVIRNCSEKLKPCLAELIQSRRTPLSAYSEVIATICQKNDVLEKDKLNRSGLYQIYEETFFGEVSPEGGRSSKMVLGKGNTMIRNGKHMAVQVSPKQNPQSSRRGRPPKHMTRADSDSLDLPMAEKPENVLDHSMKTKRGRKSKLSLPLADGMQKDSTSRDEGDMNMEISEKPNLEELNENIVGSPINVWWPDDQAYYKGVVHSYNPLTRKHKVIYVDGDVERLSLKDELWNFVEEGNEKTDREKMKHVASRDPYSESSRKRKSKTSFNSGLPESGVVSAGKSLSSDKELAGQSLLLRKTPKGGLSGGASGFRTGTSTDGRHKAVNKPKGLFAHNRNEKLKHSSWPEKHRTLTNDSLKIGKISQPDKLKGKYNVNVEFQETGAKSRDVVCAKAGSSVRDVIEKNSSILDDETLEAVGKSGDEVLNVPIKLVVDPSITGRRFKDANKAGRNGIGASTPKLDEVYNVNVVSSTGKQKISADGESGSQLHSSDLSTGKKRHKMGLDLGVV